MDIRVRYAPSPTGLQHIGGVRSALFNYFFARSNGGTFILRIEDTDRERFQPDSLQDIYDTFDWLGVHWDEGPDVGGQYGPYIQSERSDLYRKCADQLLESGNAYYAYDSEDELARAREDSDGKGGYDRRFRDMSDAELKRFAESGTKPVVRLRAPLTGTTTFRDAVLGEVTWSNEDVNADPILLKSDGFPTYHLANVVDDHFMEISHILRAQEWIPSAPIHVMLYAALGWEPPEFCHLPLVTGSDGQKLSKRHGSTSVLEFRRSGYLPEAIINYVTRLGWSYDDKREIFSREELEELFSLEKIQKAPAVFDYTKLEWMNGVYIRETPLPDLRSRVLPFLQEAGLVDTPPTEAQSALVDGALPLVRERLKLLSDSPEMLTFLFGEPAPYEPADLIPKRLNAESTLNVMRAILPMVEESVDRTEEDNEAVFRARADELGVKLGDVLMPVRIAVTGSRVSPPLFGSLRLIGREEVRRRMDAAIELLESIQE